MTDVSSARVECEAEVSFTDFDGTQASAPCGAPANHRVLFDDEQGTAYVEAVGGWDSYRASCLAFDDDPGTDPGPDPGRDKWGHVTVLLCDSHHSELLEEVASGAMLGVTILSDEEVAP